jgi:hypothetical protein
VKRRSQTRENLDGRIGVIKALFLVQAIHKKLSDHLPTMEAKRPDWAASEIDMETSSINYGWCPP